MRVFNPGRRLALAAGLILVACSAENTLQPDVEPSLPAQAFEEGTATATGQDKVTICHKGQTISVAEPAVRAHLAHGDTVGACGTVPSPSPNPTPTPTPTPTPSPGLTCNGLGPFYWANWSSRYTPTQFMTLLSGTVAGASTLTADSYLASSNCGGTDQVACMRRYLLADQLTINLTANPSFPNPELGGLTSSCTTVGVANTLGFWLNQGSSILASPGSFTATQIIDTRDALASFAES